MKTLVLESFFNKIAELKPCNETPIGVFSCEYCKIFKNTFLQNAYGGCFCETIKFYKDILLFFSSQIDVLCVGKTQQKYLPSIEMYFHRYF